MSYDHYAVPADFCADSRSVRAHLDEQSGATAQAEQLAEQLAARITARSPEGDEGFLSISPLGADGDSVVVASPWSKVQEARDAVIAEALPAGFGVYDPVPGVVLDPRVASEGTIQSSRHGRYNAISADAVATLVEGMAVNDYLIVSTAPQVYIQTQAEEDRYVVEHRAGSADRHYGTRVGEMDEVIGLFRAWIAGDAMASNADWERIVF